MTTKKSPLFFFLLFVFVVLLPVVSADDGTTIDDEENGFFVVPVPPPIPSDFDGDVYEHPERTTEEKENFVKATSGARVRRREDEDDGNDKIPLLTNSALYYEKQEKQRERRVMKNVLRNAKSALENAKNGKTSELERNLETLGNYLEDMESVLRVDINEEFS